MDVSQYGLPGGTQVEWVVGMGMGSVVRPLEWCGGVECSLGNHLTPFALHVPRQLLPLPSIAHIAILVRAPPSPSEL